MKRWYFTLFSRLLGNISTHNFHGPLTRARFSSSFSPSVQTSSMTQTEEDVLCSTLTDCTLSAIPPNSPDATAAFELIDCSVLPSREEEEEEESRHSSKGNEIERRVERAWQHWKNLGEPKFIVAPMVDQSELPFRMLCRKYGATGAYTPMLHSRLFVEDQKYRNTEFTTCKEDRPLFVQFCANDPEKLLAAARIAQPYCDYVDINLGCPQRIAKRGNYGAFLMDNLPLVKSLVENLASNLSVPVSCKIRIFPLLEDTIAYAKMLEAAGCSLLAVHGRTRDQKDGTIRADWGVISAVKKAVRIPVLANGNIRHLEDVYDCLRKTGADGVLSAESILENPAVFAGYRLMAQWSDNGIFQPGELLEKYEKVNCSEDGFKRPLDQATLLLEYFDLCEKYPVPWRMIRAHVHRMLGDWFRIHPDLRQELNKQYKLTFEWLRDMVHRLVQRDIKYVLHQSILCEKLLYKDFPDEALESHDSYASKSNAEHHCQSWLQRNG
uniref:tRNA-dihydrouridine(16/17) synthase [NAD(P)(+)] n=1 Tax=Araucaria cunninghamii TaxID=56994 RepID=A0A0D6RAK5_ARACU